MSHRSHQALDKQAGHSGLTLKRHLPAEDFAVSTTLKAEETNR